MPRRNHQSYNRDDEQKPGRPPRSAYEPEGAEASTQTPKTMTDPETGAQKPRPPEPGRTESDETGEVD